MAFVFLPMEKAFPAQPNQKIFRPNWVTDLCFFFGQYLLWSGLVLKALTYFGILIDNNISVQVRTTVGGQPLWLQAIEVVILSDFFIYWAHRFQHKYDFLWRFHKVHHSSETLDWLAAHREHPIDSIYTVGIVNLPALVLGFDVNAIAAFAAFLGIWAIYIHSNVRLEIGAIKMILGSPDLHHWHHDKERDRGNYANISPLMDKLFGTYVCPNKEPSSFGLKEKFPKSHLGQLIAPIIPGKIQNIFDDQLESLSKRIKSFSSSRQGHHS
ncbi:MAG: sterol desaturase family protein [Flammeovirgaceae bacterium]